jgi:hypothetical protein
MLALRALLLLATGLALAGVLQPAHADPLLVHTIAGPVTVQRVVGGFTTCQVPGFLRADVVDGGLGVAVANASAYSSCGNLGSQYLASPSSGGWSLTDPVTKVPGTILPEYESGGQVVAWQVKLVIRTAGMSQSDFVQATGTQLQQTGTV